MPGPYGTVAIVLHSHIPYVLGHNQLEEEWLFEAVAESYLPLLHGFRRLILHNISPQVTLGLTPVLLEQLADPRFAPRFVSYLERKAWAARDDQRTFYARSQAALARLAGLWAIYYQHSARFFQDELATDIIGGFRQLQTTTHGEILASAATHAYLPLLGTDTTVRAQIEIGAACYEHYFDTVARGCWLPECGYRPAGYWTPPLGARLVDSAPSPFDGRPVARQGIGQILATAGFQYFMIDQPQLTASPSGSARRSPLRVHRTAGEDPAASVESVAIFTRDFETSWRVWQHAGGYPSDPWYLEFHKKRAEGELRYWRITDRWADLDAKQPYVPEAAFGLVSAHAAQFAGLLHERLRTHWERTEEKGIVVAAFDTELFGHWWFEGVQWLTELIRHLGADEEVALTRCGAFLHNTPSQHSVSLVESSWGEGGDHRVWLSDATGAFWRHVYQAEVAMRRLGETTVGKSLGALERRILQQAGREFLLLQSSDWPFMITRRATPDHAERRIGLHAKNFQHCVQMVKQHWAGGTIPDNDWRALEQMERQHPLFQDLDPSIFWRSPEQNRSRRSAPRAFLTPTRVADPV